MKKSVAILVVSLALVSTTLLWAQNEAPEESSLLLEEDKEEDTEGAQVAPSSLTVPVGDYVRLILGLLFVALFAYGIVAFIKKLSSFKAGAGGGAIRVIDSTPLKGDATVHLVRVGREVFLVGSGGQSVELIAKITDQESLDQIEIETPPETPSKESFFSRMRSRLVSPVVKDLSVQKRSLSLLRKQKERLKGL